jgi:hypothetical protein
MAEPTPMVAPAYSAVARLLYLVQCRNRYRPVDGLEWW